ncbi:MAG TPA: FAD-dependent oxidoreductase [Rubrivivax sp.]|nr:FAD-dependent oxidoreductase [Rubrivivax sp.]
MEHPSDYLIIGAGMAGAAAALALREADAAAAIAMLGDEAQPPYDRPPLSKALWKDGKEQDIWRPILFELGCEAVGTLDARLQTVEQ